LAAAYALVDQAHNRRDGLPVNLTFHPSSIRCAVHDVLACAWWGNHPVDRNHAYVNLFNKALPQKCWRRMFDSILPRTLEVCVCLSV